MAALALLVVGGSLILLYAGFTGAPLVASFQAALQGTALPTSGSSAAAGGAAGGAIIGGAAGAGTTSTTAPYQPGYQLPPARQNQLGQ